MVRKTLLFILLLGLARGLYAQLQPLQTFYAQNSMTVNPANTGIQAKGSVYLWHRSQWLGFDGAPSTEILSFEYPLMHSSFGANIMYDNHGPESNTSFTGYYAFMFDLSDMTHISLGINAGLNHYGYDASKINLKDQGEAFLENNQSLTYFTAGAGITFFSDKWFVGLSSPSLVPVKINQSASPVQTDFMPSIYFNAGGTFPVSYNIYAQPSVLIRYNNSVPVSMETNVMLLFYDKFLFGLSYRLNAAYSAMIGYHLTENFKIGYAFDLDANPIRKYNNGSHEIFLKYIFETRQANVRFQSPRFF